jgi:hypothetical protein
VNTAFNKIMMVVAPPLLLLVACAGPSPRGDGGAPVDERRVSAANAQRSQAVSGRSSPQPSAAKASPPTARKAVPGDPAAPRLEPADPLREEEPSRVWTPSSPQARRQTAPVVALLDNARTQHAAGDTQAAVVSVERALRIEPRNALLWNRLARLRLQQKRPGLAAQLAAKSNALAGNDPRLKRDNWSVIAAARRMQGDSAGARAAQRKAEGVKGE